MNTLGAFDILSILATTTSLILAIVAILAAIKSEKEVRNNFEKTQNMMIDYELRIKDVLAEIDKKSAVIEKTVSESQKELMSTMTNIINETIIPKKQDMSEKLGEQFLQTMINNPQHTNSMVETLTSLSELMKNET